MKHPAFSRFLSLFAAVVLSVASARAVDSVISASNNGAGTQLVGTGSVQLVLTSQGTEGAVGFSVTFDPAVLRYDGFTNGTGLASNGASGTASLNVNFAAAATGKIGILAGFSGGGTFSAGNRQLVLLNFTVLATSSISTAIAYSDSPIFREISDAAANPLTVTFNGATLTAVPALSALQNIAAKSVTAGSNVPSFVPVGAVGGTSPYVYSVNPALPSALALNPATGAITGTPAATATATTYTVTITDATTTTASNTFSLTINSALVTTVGVGSKALTINTGAVAFTPVTASAGTSPYTYAITGPAALPTGLSINANTGAISGTPTVTSASTTYTVTATDAAGATSSKSFSLVINPVLVATGTLNAKIVTQAATIAAFVPVTAAGGTGPYSFVIAPALPNGLVLNSSTGAISGASTEARSATSYVITVTDSVGAVAAQPFSLTVNGVIIGGVFVPDRALTVGTAAVTYSPVGVSGGTPPYTFSVSPALPAGLSFGLADGAISGTPTSAVPATVYYVSIADDGGAVVSNRPFTLTVNPALTSTLAVATKGLTLNSAVVAFTPVTTAGGTSPFAFAVSPPLPAGLTLSTNDGSVSGTPTAATAAADYTVTITDGAGATINKAFNLTVNAALVATQVIAMRDVTAGAAITAFTPVTAAGGSAPLVFSVSPALPAGLSINSGSGAISGNPTAAATPATYTVTVTDAAGATANAAFALNVNGPLAANQSVANKSLTAGNGAASSFVPVTATGGTAPYTYSISPALPAALNFETTGVLLPAGSVYGTPAAAAVSKTYTVTVTDAVGAVASNTFVLTINPVVTAGQAVATKRLTVGTAAVAFAPLAVSGGTPPYFYHSPNAVVPALPAGLSLGFSTGLITGSPTAVVGATTHTVTVTDSNGAQANNTFDLTVNVPLAAGTTLASRTLSAGTAAASFTPLSLSGGTTPYVWTVTTLPANLTIDPESGAITGMPAAALASTNVTVTGTDAAGAQVSHVFALVVNAAITTTQAVATVGPLSAGTAISGSVTPVTAAGGTSPYTFGVSPALPAGLTLNTATGAITGTPTAASSAITYTVTATDAVGAASSKTFSLTVNGPLAANVAIAAKALTAGTAATSFIPVTGGGGTVPYTFAISPALPSALVFNTTTGAITGIPGAARTPSSYTVTITDAASGSVNASFSLAINPAIATTLAVASKALSVGTPAMPFTPVTAVDGTPAYTFSVAPALPAGLALSATTGEISGTPTAAAATADYTISVSDTVGATSTKVFSLTVNSALVGGAGTVATKTLTATTAAVAFTPLPLAGGTTPYGFAVNPPLPAGLVLSSTTGVISGTAATAEASAVYTILGFDAAGAQVMQALTLTVNPALVATQAIATRVLLTNVVATAFTPVTIAGGTSAFVYTIMPALPAGLSIDAATGAISGTPTVTLATTTFTVTVTDAVGATASQSFSLGVNTAPVITTQPVNARVNLNGSATFSVVATGFPTPTYQWKKDGTDITGNASATTATLTLANAQLTDEAGYSVVVTNASGTATSAPAATLTLFVLPAITTQPASQTILAGQTATFSVVATGKPAPTYQWRRNGTAIAGATADTLNLPNVSLTGGGDITVDVTNVSGAFGGSVISAPAAVLTVNPIAPVILSTPPLAATAVQGRSFLFGPITINNTPATFTATGLTGAGAPDGLVVNSTLGTISGSPLNLGTFPIVLTVTNVTGNDSRTITLTVQAPPPVISSAAAAGGRVGTPFTFAIVASNSPTAYAATSLPAGLSVNTTTGAITGTPTSAGSSSVQLTVTNASGSVTQPLFITIEPPLNAPVYTGPTSLSGTQGTAFTFTPAFGTVTAPYALSGTLPTGLTFTPATGVIAGTPTQTGNVFLTLSATNAGGTTSVNLTLVINAAAAAPVITSTGIAPGARVGTAFSFQLTSIGTPAASSYSANNLPAGVTLASATGLISGTPTAFGTFNVSVSATNTVGTGPSSTLVISVAPSASAPVIVSSPIIAGTANVAFTGVSLAASPAATSFAITSGALPAGLALDTTNGAITGTPLAAGQTRVWFAGTNASGTGLALEVLFNIAPAASTPVVNSNGTAAAQVGQPFQYVITATNGPLTGFGASGRPAWLALDAATGILSGIPTEATTEAILITMTATNAGGTGSPKPLRLSVDSAPATPVITSPLTAIGRVGTAFTYEITGSATPTSFVATNLPAGLVLNSATGAITGAPTVANTFNVSLRAANAGGLGAPSTLVIEISPSISAPAITSNASATAQVGAAFSYQIVATNGPILSYNASSKEIPSGLTLNTSTGVISGSPSGDPRTYLVSITATNAGGTSLPQVLSIIVDPAVGVPVLSTPLFVTGTVGTDFSLNITASNLTGTAPYAPPILLEAVGLPAGIAVNPSTGLIAGKPTAVGTTVATLTATNAAGTGPARDLSIDVRPAPSAPVVGGDATAVGQVGEPFTYQIVASNTPTSYEVLNSPAWITLNSVTGAVTGVPTNPGPFTVQLTASNASGTSNPAPLALFISPAANTPVVTNTRTADGRVGDVFSYLPSSAPAATAYIASGIPGGLRLNATTGEISGRPNVSGKFNVILTPSNANGIGAPATIEITIAANVTFR